MFVAIAVAAVSWLANWEPVVVDNTAIAVRPPDRIIERIDADPADPRSVPEYRLSLGQEQVFGYQFWLHNDSPFPLTITQVGPEDGSSELHVTDVRLGPAIGSGTTSYPTSTPPYTIPAHAYAAINVRMFITGCIEAKISVNVYAVPISYEMFGFIHHDTTIAMPMTVTVVGPSIGPPCGA
jgi:hypothetical protein